MDDETTGPSHSRRTFLSRGVSALAGGIVGGAAYATAADAKGPNPGSTSLPWPWRSIDPMEAGSRAYRYYHDVGG